MKTISLIIFLSICFTAIGQKSRTTIVDSIANSIDKDTYLMAKTITLDTLHLAYGAMVKTEVTFIAYADPVTNCVRKVVCNNEGNFYDYVTIYYHKGAAIKGIVKARYKRTDINPEFETHSIFYYQQDKVVKESELNGKIPCKWFLVFEHY